MHAVIQSDRVVTPNGVIPAYVRVEDGMIRSVTPQLDPPPGQYSTLDATGLVVMPGGVDFHTHLELEVGGVRTAGDWASLSLAALWGGTTTVVDFAEPGPDGSLLSGLLLQQERAAGAVVDYGLHMTVTDASAPRLDELEKVVGQGQTSLKVYTAYPDRLMLEPDALELVFRRAAELGARVMVHCEDGHAIEENIRRAKARGETSAIQHALTRPPETEERSVRQVIELAAKTGAAVHLAHLSTAGAVAALREARGSGVVVTAETCPQYLWLEESRLRWPAPAGLCHVCAPPLRTALHLDALWDGLTEGCIDVVTTDHCAFHWHDGKDRGLTPAGEDFTSTPGGLPGVETRLPLVYAGGVEAGRFSLERFVYLVSTGPAWLAGLYPRKGVIAPGADADLCLFDPESGTDLNAESLHMQVDHSPYEGLWAQGRVVAVMRSGVLVVADGEVVNPPPPGRLLRRAPIGSTDESRSRP